jgi:hypothetical protein
MSRKRHPSEPCATHSRVRLQAIGRDEDLTLTAKRALKDVGCIPDPRPGSGRFSSLRKVRNVEVRFTHSVIVMGA